MAHHIPEVISKTRACNESTGTGGDNTFSDGKTLSPAIYSKARKGRFKFAWHLHICSGAHLLQF